MAFTPVNITEWLGIVLLNFFSLNKTNKIFRFHDCDFAPVIFFHSLSLDAVWFAMLVWPRGDPKVSVLHFVKREVTPLSL